MILKTDKYGNLKTVTDENEFSVTNNHTTITILGGEFAIVSDRKEVAIKTLLGSCVAMMFFDRRLKIKAMNHFLLPETKNHKVVAGGYKYGLHSLEAMLNEMYKLGSNKRDLSVKIAGGAHILSSSTHCVGDDNVNFARAFCQNEHIDIVSEHTLGIHGRVVMIGNNFETFIKTIENPEMDKKIADDENRLSEDLTKFIDKSENRLTWF
jgi:chemotaxis protein CheD